MLRIWLIRRIELSVYLCTSEQLQARFLAENRRSLEGTRHPEPIEVQDYHVTSSWELFRYVKINRPREADCQTRDSRSHLGRMRRTGAQNTRTNHERDALMSSACCNQKSRYTLWLYNALTDWRFMRSGEPHMHAAEFGLPSPGYIAQPWSRRKCIIW